MSEKTNGRAENGQFAPGNKGGPGNPFARRTAALRKAAVEHASEQDVAEVMAALKVKALAGDVAAAKLWLAYTVGKPGASADPDTLDAHDLEVRRQAVATEEDTKALFERLPASVMCELAGAVAPHVRGHMARTLAEGMGRQGETQEVNRPGLPEGLAKLFEARPACGPSYADVLREVGEGLLGPLAHGERDPIRREGQATLGDRPRRQPTPLTVPRVRPRPA